MCIFPLPSSALSVPESPSCSIPPLGLSQNKPAVLCPWHSSHKPAHNVSVPGHSETLSGTMAGKGHLDPKTYRRSILFVNNKPFYPKDGEGKCPQYCPFEKLSAGDHNLQYSVHFNSLTLGVRVQQIQHWVLGRHPDGSARTKVRLELVINV